MKPGDLVSFKDGEGNLLWRTPSANGSDFTRVSNTFLLVIGRAEGGIFGSAHVPVLSGDGCDGWCMTDFLTMDQGRRTGAHEGECLGCQAGQTGSNEPT